MRSEINSQAASPLNELSDDTQITRTQFEELLAKIDKGLRALPATAQVSSFDFAIQASACQNANTVYLNVYPFQGLASHFTPPSQASLVNSLPPLPPSQIALSINA